MKTILEILPVNECHCVFMNGEQIAYFTELQTAEALVAFLRKLAQPVSCIGEI